MNTVLAIVGAAAMIALFVAFESWQRKRKLERAFAGRASLGSEQFYEAYFKERGIPFHIVSGVRSILEELLSADLSRLVDSDDFSKNLSFFWDFDSMADVEIVCALEERFAIKISDAEAEQTKTIADIVDLVHSKSSAPNAA